MMEETALVDAIKEAVCFVSGDLRDDLAAAREGEHRLEYVLPNGVTTLRGFVRPPRAPAHADTADAPEQARSSAACRSFPCHMLRTAHTGLCHMMVQWPLRA